MAFLALNLLIDKLFLVCFYGRNTLFHWEKQSVSNVGTMVKQYFFEVITSIVLRPKTAIFGQNRPKNV